MDNSLAHVCIAHQHIKDRRAHKIIPSSPENTLADYVPFYFAPRSPMLYVISHGGVEGYSGGQIPILHLVSSVEAVEKAGIEYVFTDGHADVDISNFYTNVDDLDKIDWAIMGSRYWNDTIADGDRKRRRQAEFLIKAVCPWSLIENIGVYNRAISQQVSGLLHHVIHKPIINILPIWYY